MAEEKQPTIEEQQKRDLELGALYRSRRQGEAGESYAICTGIKFDRNGKIEKAVFKDPKAFCEIVEPLDGLEWERIGNPYPKYQQMVDKDRRSRASQG